MKTRESIAVVLVFLLVVLAGGALWLANARMMPPVQKVEQLIPDDRIPH